MMNDDENDKNVAVVVWSVELPVFEVSDVLGRFGL